MSHDVATSLRKETPAQAPAGLARELRSAGPGPASDCLDVRQFEPGWSTGAQYQDSSDDRLSSSGSGASDTGSPIGLSRATVRTLTGAPIASAHGTFVPMSVFSVDGSDSAVATRTIRYLRLEGYEQVLAATATSTVVHGITVGDEKTVAFSEPLARDRTFALWPGEAHTMRFVTGGESESFSTTTLYGGQETLSVLGKTYTACRFEVTDSRQPGLSTTQWYVKSPVEQKGLLLRSETGGHLRELIEGESRAAAR